MEFFLVDFGSTVSGVYESYIQLSWALAFSPPEYDSSLVLAIFSR